MKLSLALSILLALAAQADAVGTSHWTAGSEADFKKGTLHNVVATNLGDLKLSRAVKTLLEQDARIGAVYCLAEGPDGTLYAGTGPNGVLLRIKGEDVTPVATLGEDVNIFALRFDPQGRLLLATGGERGKILRFDHPDQLAALADGKPAAKPAEIFSAEGVQYVWCLAQTPDGKLYAGTGPEGQVFEIDPDGTHTVLFDSDENNMLSMVSDGKDLLYVGTDPNGLIYRINRKTKDVFVLYDAAEAEVSCLALDAAGNLYAGTSEAAAEDAEEVKPPDAPSAAPAPKGGRPEGTGGAPLPSKTPEPPAPPALPDPNPGEPDPIPKSRHKASIRYAVPLDGDEPVPAPSPRPDPAPKPDKNKPKAGRNAKPTTAPAAPPADAETGKARAGGNAVYRIDPDGFVTEIFRQPVLVLSLLEREGVLLVGTGNDGLVYQVNPATEETVVLAHTEPHHVVSLLAAKDGRVLMGLANVGAVASLSNGFAPDGTFTSPVQDATQISRFGKLHLHGTLPAGTGLTLSTRSGNVQDPNHAGWSDWSPPASAETYLQIASPSARFLQYRLTLSSKDGKASPVVDEVDVAYQMPNLAPVVHSVTVTAKNDASDEVAVVAAVAPNAAGASNKPVRPTIGGTRVQTIAWEADDPNADALLFAVYARAGGKGREDAAGAAGWILLKDKLTDPHYEWDTRTVADGRYEIKVVASDERANPPGQGKTASRVSDALLVDNTPPVIGDVKATIETTPQGSGVRIKARLVDRTSTVAACEYALDSAADWQSVLPSDSIYDSPEETVNFVITHLSPGSHQIALRATDAKGNQAYETVNVRVETVADAGKRADNRK